MAERPADIRLTDPDLGDYPYIYVTGHGHVRFSDEEWFRLREYLTASGFVHVDYDYGLDESFRREIRRLSEDRVAVKVPLDHAVYHAFYDFTHGLPRIHECDGEPARGFSIFTDGHLAPYYSYHARSAPSVAAAVRRA